MQILLPIAGLGTRVRPHTHVRPKPLLSLAGKPVLGHLLDYLLQLRPSSVIFIVGERGEMIERYVRDNYDVPVHFRVQQELRGQSHAIRMAADAINEPVLIVFGDSLFEAPLDQLVDTSVDGAICVQPVDDPSRFGVIETRDGVITRLIEKPQPGQSPSNLATIGVYMLNDHKALLRAIDEQIAGEDPVKGEFFIAGALQRMMNAGSRLRPVEATGWWDTGTIAAVLDAHRHLVAQHPCAPKWMPSAAVIPPCYIHPTAKLERCSVGPYVTIGAGSEIVDSVIADSIVGTGSRISGQVLRRSIIGDDVELRGIPLSFSIADQSAIGPVLPDGGSD